MMAEEKEFIIYYCKSLSFALVFRILFFIFLVDIGDHIDIFPVVEGTCSFQTIHTRISKVMGSKC